MKAPADPHARLLAAYAEGDMAAARALAEALGPRLLATATRVLGDAAEAEDVVQETMLRLWRKASSWQEARAGAAQARVSTWVTRVALNLATDRLRRRRGVAWEDAFAGGEEPESGDHGREAEMHARARATALRQALARLPRRQAQAIALRHFDELSNPEIAEIMNTGIEAVESLLARGRRGLARELAPRRDALGWDGALAAV